MRLPKACPYRILCGLVCVCRLSLIDTSFSKTVKESLHRSWVMVAPVIFKSVTLCRLSVQWIQAMTWAHVSELIEFRAPLLSSVLDADRIDNLAI